MNNNLVSNTPFEYITQLIDTIEKTRKKRKIRQTDLCSLADVSISTYQAFIYKRKISLETLIKIMYVLKMGENLERMCKYDEPLSLDEIRERRSKKNLVKRIRIEK
jgi:transcriptional regulator with XRE-family HTH domain